MRAGGINRGSTWSIAATDVRSMKNWEAMLVALVESDEVALTARQIVDQVRSKGWPNLRGNTPWNTVVRDMKDSSGRAFFKKNEFLNTHSDMREEYWGPNGEVDIASEVARIKRRYPTQFPTTANVELKNDSPPASCRTRQLDSSKMVSFSPEFDGIRSEYTSGGSICRIVEHGVVVNALATTLRGEQFRIANSAQRDLCILDQEERIAALFEIKTDTSPQAIYTAVGQLLMHSIVHQP
jgi:hypothetical protein